ncbi:MAG: DUF1294 domain-containing protein [Planctomycetales bacterium]
MPPIQDSIPPRVQSGPFTRLSETLWRAFGNLCLLILLGLLLLILDSLTIRWLHPSEWLIVYAWYVLILSLITVAVYGIDKRRATRDSSRRIPESTLHLLTLLGGIPGAVLGQQWFHHKNRKTSFRLVFWLMCGLHLAVLIAIPTLIQRWNHPS